MHRIALVGRILHTPPSLSRSLSVFLFPITKNVNIHNILMSQTRLSYSNIAIPKNGNTTDTNSNRNKVCVIVGTGEGIGSSLAKRFAIGGYKTVVVRRNAVLLQETVYKIEKEISASKLALENITSNTTNSTSSIIPYACDARDEDQVIQLFHDIESKHGPVDVCIFNIGANISFPLIETTSRKFRKCWEMACYSGFLVGREAAKHMIPRSTGTILFTGATASVRGAANFSAFSVAKAGLRSLAQSMARELSPLGIHVAHVVIDGAVDTPWVRDNFQEAVEKLPPDGLCQPDEIAEVYWQLSRQHRSTWSFEVDLRPYCERW